MMHDGCYLGAMLSLGSVALRIGITQDDSAETRKALNEVQTHWELAQNLTETCRISTFTLTGLPPNELFMNNPDGIEGKSYAQTIEEKSLPNFYK